MAGYLKRKVEVSAGRVVETITLTAAEDVAQKVVLAFTTVSQIFLTIPCGTPQIENQDYELINGNEISWAGKSLETSLTENDTIIVIYNN